MALDIPPPKRDLPRKSKGRDEMHRLWRLFAWGGTAALALTALAIATRSDIGGERLRLAFAAPKEVAPAAVAVPPHMAEKDIEMHELEAQVRSLAADRDRLAERLASLEHQLDDVTGSIQKQAAETPPPPAASAPAPVASVPQAAAAPPAPAPVPPPAPAATVASIAPPPIIDPLAMPVPADIEAFWPEPPHPHGEAGAQAPPLPPARLVALPPGAGEPVAQPLPAAKVEYGIELANGPNIGALRARWSVMKANIGPLLGPLQPVAVRDHRPGNTGSYRLVAGPLPNYTAARQVCARFAAAHIACRPTRFDGQSMVQR